MFNSKTFNNKNVLMIKLKIEKKQKEKRMQQQMLMKMQSKRNTYTPLVGRWAGPICEHQ